MFCLFITIISTICLFGCNQSNSKQLYNKIMNCTNNVEKVINNLYIPTNSDLIIPEFVDKNSDEYINLSIKDKYTKQKWHAIFSFEETKNYEPKYVNNNIINSQFNDFVSKLSNLNLQMTDSICAVNELKEKKTILFDKIDEIKQKCNEIKKENLEKYKLLLCKELTNEIEYLCNNITNKDKETKSEVKQIKSLKYNISLNANTLSNSYIVIVNNLDDKISCMDKIYICYNQILGIINANDMQNHYISTKILEDDTYSTNNLSYIKLNNTVNNLTTNNLDNNKDKSKIIPLPYIIENENNKNHIEYI